MDDELVTNPWYWVFAKVRNSDLTILKTTFSNFAASINYVYSQTQSKSNLTILNTFVSLVGFQPLMFLPNKMTGCADVCEPMLSKFETLI